MGDVVNLNKVRKAKARSDAKVVAEANRAKFGRTKAEKDRDRIDKTRADRLVDGAKLED
ncbi:DUF4169 domain-containing protein [Rhizorhabdus wittichii DC-6]|nr:DUF4169 domain-containing protein [Rhizorhabdus wittichii DC-6]